MGYSIVAALAARRPLGVGDVEVVEEKVRSEASDEQIIVQVIRLGDLCLVGVSAECFTEMGIVVKGASPFPQTFFCSNANGCVGYLPTREAFAEGGYEVVTGATGRSGLAEHVSSSVLTAMERIQAHDEQHG